MTAVSIPLGSHEAVAGVIDRRAETAQPVLRLMEMVPAQQEFGSVRANSGGGDDDPKRGVGDAAIGPMPRDRVGLARGRADAWFVNRYRSFNSLRARFSIPAPPDRCHALTMPSGAVRQQTLSARQVRTNDTCTRRSLVQFR